MKIDLCIATFRRPMIAETLASVEAAQRPEDVELAIIVIDNDSSPSARETVLRSAEDMSIPVHYAHVPGANISLARNAALDMATGDFLAFLDDDELVDRMWLVELVGTARRTEADAVFGPSLPLYPDSTPEWIVDGGFHRQDVPVRHGRVETGHTCNGLLRWRGTPWQNTRFDLRLGRTGGEDTLFFSQIFAMGAAFQINNSAIVRERIPQERLTFRWLVRRRFRIGQTHGELASGIGERASRFFTAAAKAIYCGVMTGLVLLRPERRAFWALRGVMHCGVCAGCLSLPQKHLYDPHGLASK